MLPCVISLCMYVCTHCRILGAVPWLESIISLHKETEGGTYCCCFDLCDTQSHPGSDSVHTEGKFCDFSTLFFLVFGCKWFIGTKICGIGAALSKNSETSCYQTAAINHLHPETWENKGQVQIYQLSFSYLNLKSHLLCTKATLFSRNCCLEQIHLKMLTLHFMMENNDMNLPGCV